MMRPPADLLDANETAGKIQTMPEPKKHRKTTNLNMRIDPQLKAEFSAKIGRASCRERVSV